MAGCLKFSYICLSIFLLVLPLVCSKDEENNGKDDMEELLQNLLKAEKERRQLSDETNAKGSRGTEEGDTNHDENVPDIETHKRPDGGIESDVSENKESKQKVIQDCENKYELIMDKDLENGGGSCYLHKMNDDVYKKDCQGINIDAEITVGYQIGKQIENATLLSSIKGIDGCTGKNISELIEVSVKKRNFDEYEKRLAERRGYVDCTLLKVDCYPVCVQRAGWWWNERCVRHVMECRYLCRFSCP